MKLFKLFSLFLAAVLLVSLSTAPATADSPETEGESVSYEEGTSDTDDIVNTSAAKKVLLVVSFGTSFNQSRALTIGGIETALRDAYPDYQVRRAFTSQIIIDKLAERDSLNIDNIEQAMDRLVLDRVNEVVVQPTTVMSGYEYDDVAAVVAGYADKFESLKIGAPLLTDDSDYDAVAEIIVSETSQFREDGTAIVFMGHGTHHEANATYAKLQGVLNEKGCDDYLIGLVEGSEGSPLLDYVKTKLAEMGAKKAVLRPLMVVAGDHANNDMAGAEEDSWKTVLTNEGYAVETIVEGLGQVEGIQDIYIKHVKNAIDSENLSVSEVSAAAAADTAAVQPKDGVYSIEVESDSSMFRIVECRLTVQNGVMTAFMTLSGQGFSRLFMGTGEQALENPGTGAVDFVDNSGRHAFTVSVSALDTELPCAGFSARRETWYDYTVVFKSDTLQSVSAQAGTTDERQIDVVLGGGSGRSGVDSPAALFTRDGADYARIVWSSPNYSYMMVNNKKYLPVNDEGNSTFEIPVLLDTDMAIAACTVAMSAPREIEYTLYFDSASIK